MNSRWAQWTAFLGLTALCGILFFPSLGRIPFFNKGEPREALVVQEIFHHGDWLFPLKRGEEIPSKPPLFHWFGTVSSIAWGDVTEATVRFPSALFATLGVWVVYLLGRRLFSAEEAVWAGVILATSVGYQSEAISARVDMTLSFFVTLSLVIFYLLYREVLRGELWRYAWYLLLGISVLAKGPVGLLLPGMIIFVFLALRRKWGFMSRLCFHKGAIVALAIPLGWYGLALAQGGEDFFARQVLHENLARFFVYGEGGTGHQKPFFYYFPYLMVGGLPWTLFLPFAIFDAFKRRIFSRDHLLFLSLWAGIIFLFFSLSAGKRAPYLLPLYPALSLLIALWLARGEGEMGWGAGFRTVGSVSVFIGLGLLLVAWAMAEPLRLERGLSLLQAVLKPKDQGHLGVVREALSKAGPIFFLSVLLSAGLWFLAAAQLFFSNSRGAAAALVSLSVVASLLAQGPLLRSIAAANTYKPFMTEVNRRVGRNGSLLIYGPGWDYTSVVFYRGQEVPIIEGDSLSLVKRLRQSEDFYILGEREWKNLAAAGNLSFRPILTSEGLGPEGKDRIVLIRGGTPQEARE